MAYRIDDDKTEFTIQVLTNDLVVGDISYIFEDKETLDSIVNHPDFLEGYINVNDKRIGIVHSTKWGKGLYSGKNFEYPVNERYIAAIDDSSLNKTYPDSVLQFLLDDNIQELTLQFNDGLITLLGDSKIIETIMTDIYIEDFNKNVDNAIEENSDALIQ